MIIAGIIGINSGLARKSQSRKSMVATWPNWQSGPSLSVTMKYSRYVHYKICHGKQDAKVILDGYKQQFSTKSVERATRSIKENLWKHLNGLKYGNYIFAGRFSEQCQEQRSSDKVPDQSPDTCLSRCPTSKIRCCFHSHIFAQGVLDAVTVIVGNDRDLLVKVIVTAQVDAQLYMLHPSNSNTTVLDITRLLNSVGKCNIACSPYTLWLGVALPRSYYLEENITCKLFKENTGLAKDLSAFRHYAYTHAMVRKSVNDSFKLTILSHNWCCS